jgi:diguanylate cyclase (GGDEF)-like protein
MNKRSMAVIADDDPTIRKVMKAALEKVGFEVIDVENGALACTAFAQHSPQIVLLDVEMPVQDGFSTCAQIRRLPGGEVVPIVMVTGRDDVEAVDEAYRAGATDFVAKPINWPIFQHRVQYVLRASHHYQEMRRSEAKNEVLLRAIPDTFVVLGANDEVYDFIPGKFNRPMPEPKADDVFVSDFLPEKVARSWRRASRFVSERGEPARIEFAIRVGERLTSHYEARFLPYVDRRTLVLVSEITDRKIAEQRIRRLAFYDTLTGLPNRQAFRMKLSDMLDEAKDKGERLAVVYIDLDNFKRINDTLGHSIGDGVLDALAKRLSRSVRQNENTGQGEDVPAGVARLGGDEFGCVITGFESDQVLESIAERICDQLRQPLPYKGHEFVVTPSMGVSVFPSDGEDVEDLLKNADVAMYQAKDAGRDTVCFYSGTMSIRSLHGLAIEQDLRKALENDELELHYQPKLDIATGKLVGAEALIRWRKDNGEYIPPSRFIPLAEQNGLIIPLGDWVLRTACRQAHDWDQKFGNVPRIAVNISSQQFYQSDLQTTVMKALFEAGTRPSLLQLELTESILMRDVERTIATLEYLKNTGITLAMDDFGTGYSSLSYLKRFPIDALKIDRSFVMDVEASNDGATICAAIIAMARQLGLIVIAEGVETREQLEFLRSQNCDQIQGFLFSKPICAADYERRFLASPVQSFKIPADGTSS